MANASILGDIGSACPRRPPAPVVSGSSSVLINGTPVTLLGSPIANGSVVVAGSSSVLIEGQPASRVGDSTSCGVILGAGSSNVLIGWIIFKNICWPIQECVI